MRARNIKPGLFKNEDLAEVDLAARMLFIGLWLLADRSGFLAYRPKRIAIEIFPYDSNLCTLIVKLLDQLHTARFIDFYCDENGKRIFIHCINFELHQNPHVNEKASKIKPLILSMVQEQYKDHSTRADSLIPDSLIPDSHSYCSEVQKAAPAEPDKIELVEIMVFPLNKKSEEFIVYQHDIEEWQETFPGIDVLQQLKKCRQWNIDYPRKRKTKRGIRGHISFWLGRAQDQAGYRSQGKATIQPRSVRDARILANDKMADMILTERENEQTVDDSETAHYESGQDGVGKSQLPLS